jgi:biopolymer transport protein ExbB
MLSKVKQASAAIERQLSRVARAAASVVSAAPRQRRAALRDETSLLWIDDAAESNPSRGEVLMTGSALARLVENGGVTLYPLLLCSIVSVAVLIERAVTIARATRARARVHNLVVRAVAQNNLGEALAIGRMSGSRFTSVYEDVLTHPDRDTRGRLAQRRDAESARELRRHVWLLGTIGSLAPFIGLFGTVVGIIRAFDNMAATGSGGFAVVAAGISEALIATAGGLVVGVLSIFAYNAFMVRIGNVTGRWRDWTDELLMTLGDAPLGEEPMRVARSR